MTECRTITKYPNRRLYDRSERRYVTLAEIRKLVNEQADFVVLERRSQADITREVLLRVVAEQEREVSLLSRNFLLQLIRICSGPAQHSVGAYLDDALKEFRDGLPSVAPSRTLTTVTSVQALPAP